MNYLVRIWKKITALPGAATTRTVKFMFPLVLGFVAVLGASVIGTNSSYIRLEPSQTEVMAGERFSIDIYASAHVPVNALDIEIKYLPEAVTVLSIDKTQSVITIWTEEPVIGADTISLSGGTFRRGFVGEHLVATIKVEAKSSGQTEFMVSEAELLAGDGKGTPVAVTGTGEASRTSFYIYDQNEDPAKITANLGIRLNPDIDGDGKVSLRDISSFMAAWHSKQTNYDFNSDGKMNFIDFSIILAKSFF